MHIIFERAMIRIEVNGAVASDAEGTNNVATLNFKRARRNFLQERYFFPSSMPKLTTLSDGTFSLPADEDSMKCRLTLNNRCFFCPGVISTSSLANDFDVPLRIDLWFKFAGH